ncbi:MAG: hypothetical protein ABII64_05510 [Elusimicrobiota bacterium]
MNTVLMTCVVTLTVAIVVAVVFFVKTMIQVRRTAGEAETLLKTFNYEADRVKSFTENVTGFVENAINSPWLRFGSVASTIVSGIVGGLRKGKAKASAE